MKYEPRQSPSNSVRLSRYYSYVTKCHKCSESIRQTRLHPPIAAEIGCSCCCEPISEDNHAARRFRTLSAFRNHDWQKTSYVVVFKNITQTKKTKSARVGLGSNTAKRDFSAHERRSIPGNPSNPASKLNIRSIP